MQDIYKKEKAARDVEPSDVGLLLYKLLAWAFHGEMVLPPPFTLSNVPPFLFSRTVGTLPRP